MLYMLAMLYLAMLYIWYMSVYAGRTVHAAGMSAGSTGIEAGIMLW